MTRQPGSLTPLICSHCTDEQFFKLRRRCDVILSDETAQPHLMHLMSPGRKSHRRCRRRQQVLTFIPRLWLSLTLSQYLPETLESRRFRAGTRRRTGSGKVSMYVLLSTKDK